MPIHQLELIDQTVEVGITIDGEAIVVQLPQALVGAYLIG